MYHNGLFKTCVFIFGNVILKKKQLDSYHNLFFFNTISKHNGLQRTTFIYKTRDYYKAFGQWIL